MFGMRLVNNGINKFELIDGANYGDAITKLNKWSDEHPTATIVSSSISTSDTLGHPSRYTILLTYQNN